MKLGPKPLTLNLPVIRRTTNQSDSQCPTQGFMVSAMNPFLRRTLGHETKMKHQLSIQVELHQAVW